MAGQHLLSGKADLMLAGAVSHADPFFINMGFSIFHAYPEEGATSSPLNRGSDGLYAGEGAGMFVLKRHSDALRDGDKIYAAISGIGLSNDGKGKFLLQPNPKGQILAFERAYAQANVNPADIDYVECHATGTPVVSPPIGTDDEITVPANWMFDRITSEELWACTTCRATSR
jgi:acyl transferase domain-containing protein